MNTTIRRTLILGTAVLLGWSADGPDVRAQNVAGVALPQPPTILEKLESEWFIPFANPPIRCGDGESFWGSETHVGEFEARFLSWGHDFRSLPETNYQFKMCYTYIECIWAPKYKSVGNSCVGPGLSSVYMDGPLRQYFPTPEGKKAPYFEYKLRIDIPCDPIPDVAKPYVPSGITANDNAELVQLNAACQQVLGAAPQDVELTVPCCYAHCGNTVIDHESEQCDDGNRTNGDGCDESCQEEPEPDETPEPTDTPTAEPTDTPTEDPDEDPTEDPTPSPSDSPTDTPPLA